MMKLKNRKSSRFIKWLYVYFATFIFIAICYVLASRFGLIEIYKNEVRNNKGTFVPINFTLIFIVIIAYCGLSIYNLLSHRAVQDSREHFLPIIISPFFLLIENGLLHAFESDINYPFYEVTMGILSATVLGVITFASLKFSFEISTKQARFIETSKVKPDIKVIEDGQCNYKVNISNNDCYFCGVYIGYITKIQYWYIKRTGNDFKMHNLFFPNRKIFLKKGKTHDIKLKQLSKEVPDINQLKNHYQIFLIFRDTINYYYFAQLPMHKDDYNVIGVNEYLMERLVYKFGLLRESNKQFVKYRAIDWFRIPYNISPDYKP